MARILVVALVIVAAGGCRMCSDSCDYSPPVAESAYGGPNGRAGSVSSTDYGTLSPPTPQPPPAPKVPPATSEITPPTLAP